MALTQAQFEEARQENHKSEASMNFTVANSFLFYTSYNFEDVIEYGSLVFDSFYSDNCTYTSTMVGKDVLSLL